jgi:hypothetical protein
VTDPNPAQEIRALSALPPEQRNLALDDIVRGWRIEAERFKQLAEIAALNVKTGRDNRLKTIPEGDVEAMDVTMKWQKHAMEMEKHVAALCKLRMDWEKHERGEGAVAVVTLSPVAAKMQAEMERKERGRAERDAADARS